MTVYEGYVLKDSDYPEIPAVPGYGSYWDKYTEPVTSNVTVNGHYEMNGGINPPVDPPIQTMSVHGDTTEERHAYIYASGKLMRETITSGVTTKILDFRYDGNGNPYAMTVIEGTSRTIYFYITNLQGDVVSLVKKDGTEVASYTYDPYGKILSATGDLAELNPLRYRGYYYDSETGFYYLQSRYYDPATGRFINADNYTSTGQGILGYNMFAYCGNNPVSYSDSTGTMMVATDILCGGGGSAGYGTGIVGSPSSSQMGSVAVKSGGTPTSGSKNGVEQLLNSLDKTVVDISGPGIILKSLSTFVPSALLRFLSQFEKAGCSLVVDAKNRAVYAYIHVGLNTSPGLSGAIGVVSNYNEPMDYAKWFVDIGGGTGVYGIDHCFNPFPEKGKPATSATCLTVGSGGFSVGADYYFPPIEIFTW